MEVNQDLMIQTLETMKTLKTANETAYGNIELLLNEIQEKDKLLAAASDKIDSLKPKEEFFDAVTKSTDTIDIGQVAKILNIPNFGRNNLFEMLRKNKILQPNNQPYQKYVDCGYFRIVETRWSDKHGRPHIGLKTTVYQKGIEFIMRMLKEAA